MSGEVPPALRAAARRALALDDEALLAECEEAFFVGGGPGGQHRNKTESGVRLAHRPTGVTVTATERRSQLQNRGAALERLRARLAALAHEARPRRATRPTRGSKERRLATKRHAGRRKADRSGGWD
jgi:protein subunit release factor B